jgi:putative tricarboxylic transport membrane protein
VFDSALQALGTLLDPLRLALLLAGVVCGAVVGMLPGLGGVAVVSILLPVVYALDVNSGLAVLLGR